MLHVCRLPFKHFSSVLYVFVQTLTNDDATRAIQLFYELYYNNILCLYLDTYNKCIHKCRNSFLNWKTSIWFGATVSFSCTLYWKKKLYHVLNIMIESHKYICTRPHEDGNLPEVVLRFNTHRYTQKGA